MRAALRLEPQFENDLPSTRESVVNVFKTNVRGAQARARDPLFRTTRPPGLTLHALKTNVRGIQARATF
eukprot:8345487-Pyramimonas_sp.AAC.1